MASPHSTSSLLSSLHDYQSFFTFKHQELHRTVQEVLSSPLTLLPSKSSNKKIVIDINLLEKILKSVSSLIENDQKFVSLIKNLQDSISVSTVPSISTSFKCVTPNQMKTLKFNVNRLKDRGSLTDEEAQSMLGKISLLPVSPTNNDSGSFSSGKHFEFTLDCENRVTETRDSKLFERSHSKNIRRKSRSPKRASKRVSTPAKRIIRNTSLPKTGPLIFTHSKEKVKSLKLKSKSPHSFL
jgi:hypothetical protein